MWVGHSIWEVFPIPETSESEVCIKLVVLLRYYLLQSYAVTTEPVYNDIGLYNTSLIASDILWYQLIPHC
jgi:hypothetical protein